MMNNLLKETKISSRGISSDKIRDVPSNNQTNNLKNIITHLENSHQTSNIQIIPHNFPQNEINKPSHSSSPRKNLFTFNNRKYVLPEKVSPRKKTLILDLDETLVHSSFNQLSTPDIILKIEMENKIHQIFVLKRPFVDEFLEKMSNLFEIVIFTASLSKYADQLMDLLDKNKTCSFRLFRDSCSYSNNLYIKDLSRLGRNLKDCIIIDNVPNSYALQPENGIPILSWFDDKNDNELSKLTPVLEFLSKVYDVRDYLRKFVKNNIFDYSNAYSIIDSVNCLEKEKIKEDSSRVTPININIINNNINNIIINETNKHENSSESKVRNLQISSTINQNIIMKNIEIKNDTTATVKYVIDTNKNQEEKKTNEKPNEIVISNVELKKETLRANEKTNDLSKSTEFIANLKKSLETTNNTKKLNLLTNDQKNIRNRQVNKQYQLKNDNISISKNSQTGKKKEDSTNPCFTIKNIKTISNSLALNKKETINSRGSSSNIKSIKTNSQSNLIKVTHNNNKNNEQEILKNSIKRIYAKKNVQEVKKVGIRAVSENSLTRSTNLKKIPKKIEISESKRNQTSSSSVYRRSIKKIDKDEMKQDTSSSLKSEIKKEKNLTTKIRINNQTGIRVSLVKNNMNIQDNDLIENRIHTSIQTKPKERRIMINNVSVYSNKCMTKYNQYEKKRYSSANIKKNNEKSMNNTNNSNKSNVSNGSEKLNVITSITSIKTQQRIKMQNRFKDSPLSKIFQSPKKNDYNLHTNHFKGSS